MSSKGSKRATSTPAAPIAKKVKAATQAEKASPKKAAQVSPKKVSAKKIAETQPKIESVFAGIVTALEIAEHLPERCREMLVAMVKPSLCTPKSERHASQALGVSMIQETLQSIKAKQMEAVEQAQSELSTLEASKESRMASANDAQADFASKEATRDSKQSARDEADKFVKEAENTLANAKETQRKGEEPLAKLENEKATLEKISQEHVKAPMEANEGPHFAELEPYIQTLGLDESLAIALPSSCTKTKEQRGGFDEVVLGELEKALAEKIASLAKAIEEEVPQVAERKAAVVSAESALEQKVTLAKLAAEELEAATEALQKSSALLSKAKEELEALAPSMQEATTKLEDLQKVLSTFEAGPLATFQTYQNKAAVIEEAATAGA